MDWSIKSSLTTSSQLQNEDCVSAVATNQPQLVNSPSLPAERKKAESAPQVDEFDTATVKIMIIDDEPLNIKVVRRFLNISGYERFVEVTDSTRALQTIAYERPDIILLDLMMPIVSGIDILQQLRETPDLHRTPVIVLTASDDDQLKLQALELGATDLLRKPVNSVELAPRVRNTLMVKAHHDYLRQYAGELEEQVRQRTSELTASRLELIHCLARAAEYRDNDTGRHVVRVGRFAGIIARQLGLEEERSELIELAAPLHDLGKIGIPDSILLKPGKLDPQEYEMIQQHTLLGKRTCEPMSRDEFGAYKSHTFLGEKILGTNRSAVLEIAARIAVTHHERWDGLGYPLGLRGEDIPLEGRITAVADVFDALSSKRPYKPAFPLERCLTILEEGRGTHFDPQVLDAFFACKDEIIHVWIELADVE